MSRRKAVTLFVVLSTVEFVWCGTIWQSLNLPEEHIPYIFHSNIGLREQCLNDDQCPYKKATNITKCFGYEPGCKKEQLMLYPECYEPSRSNKAWMNHYNASSQEEVFWKQADFGFLKERLDEMTMYCEPEHPDDSSLECSTYLRMCKAKNIYMDFRRHEFTSNNRYVEDIFQKGEIGGHCKLNAEALSKQSEHKSALQSWFAELEQYTSLSFRPIKDNKCDVVVDKPTILMKLDAGVSMYHHFCDFVNLYLSQHAVSNFSQDINIINWDTSLMRYGDLFSETWNVFSDYPLQYLKQYDNKRVCFKTALFPLLARMRYGLYYNTPLISGCKDTALFRAFQQHVLHRLGVKQTGPLKQKVRVTLLSRGTKYRKILNEGEIAEALSKVNDSVPFKEQLQATLNSDIFMGIHGSGLTHLLFQPDWGAIFEIYNCDDVHCYEDLARLRGLKYYTWDKSEYIKQEDEGHHPTLGAHKKFTNYSFDVSEFLRIVKKMATYVKQHPSFRAARRLKYKGYDIKNKTEL
ncbi:hypothetical protein LSH36_367g02007 [Paralvinella palmiformis]|uniref:EGF domain-specific O-linked N-acetylglucosamine transferase n=1 Tax=Paralvinella palmiformis TaxID=53620 RepID=A0AAD9MZM1_9ANNE|nr:hypothetical protein LSH36_367g02007 [Paralvinella palmiformis]